MHLDEYNRRMALIYSELNTISERTEDMAWLKSAD